MQRRSVRAATERSTERLRPELAEGSRRSLVEVQSSRGGNNYPVEKGYKSLLHKLSFLLPWSLLPGH